MGWKDSVNRENRIAAKYVRGDIASECSKKQMASLGVPVEEEMG